MVRNRIMLKKIREHFSVRAKCYDKIWYSNEVYNQYYINSLLSQCKNINSSRFLDIGIGTGFVDYFLKDRGAVIYGIDMSKQMLTLSKKRLMDSSLILADGCHLPFKDQAFDYAFSLNTIQHVPSEQERVLFLSDIKRVLKFSGKAIIETNNLGKRMEKMGQPRDHPPDPIGKVYVHYYDINELKQLFHKAGLHIVKIEEIKHLYYSFRPKTRLKTVLIILIERIIRKTPLSKKYASFVIVIGQKK